MVGRVSSVKEYFETLQDRFISDQAKGVTATYVYELDGADGGTWTVKINDGTLEVVEGDTPDSNVRYLMKAENYVKMVNGDLSGPKAFMTRKLKVKGSIPLAQKMNKFLPPLS